MSGWENNGMNEKKQNKGPFDVRRNILLAPAPAEKLQEMLHRLRAIEPVIDSSLDQHGHLSISYDASRIGMHDIETMLDETGIARSSSLWWKVKSDWYRYLDENAKSNARSEGGACCNHPPAVQGGNSIEGKIH